MSIVIVNHWWYDVISLMNQYCGNPPYLEHRIPNYWLMHHKVCDVLIFGLLAVPGYYYNQTDKIDEIDKKK